MALGVPKMLPVQDEGEVGTEQELEGNRNPAATFLPRCTSKVYTQ